MYAETLQPWFEKLSNDGASHAMLHAAVGPTMATLFLVWQNCPFYGPVKRLTSLVRSIGNELIKQCKLRIDMDKLMVAPDLLLHEIRAALALCAEFRGQYQDFRSKAAELNPKSSLKKTEPTFVRFKHQQQAKEEGSVEWPGRQDPVFSRINKFMDRCNEVLDIAETIVHFTALDSIIIGGPMALDLTPVIQYVYADFLKSLQHLGDQQIDYLNIDISADEFEAVFCKFKLDIKRFERQLLEIFHSSFQDNMSLPERLQVVASYRMFCERDAINAGLRPRYMEVISMIEC